MVATMNHLDLDAAKTSLITRGLATDHCRADDYPPMGIAPMQSGIDLYNTIIIDSEPTVSTGLSESELKELATTLKEIYPKGKKDDRFYWADGVALIVKRLKAFFKKYGNDYTSEDIIDATQRYVDSKLGQPDMRLLKYFIFKEGRNAATNEVESSSDLLTYVENKDEDSNSDWMLNVQ